MGGAAVPPYDRIGRAWATLPIGEAGARLALAALRMSLGRRFKGGALGMIGFLLSPLSWWNDLFVNVPLALAFAWMVGLVWPAGFTASFIAGYWLTNVLGLVLLQKGARQALTDQPPLYSGRELLKDLLVSLLYTLVIVALIKLKVFQPIWHYSPM
jgi:hypothetical protein